MRSPLARYLAANLVPAVAQLAGSSFAVAAQTMLAQSIRRRSAPPRAGGPELRRVTYLRPIAGIAARVGGSVTHAHGVIRALDQIGVATEPYTTDPLIAETAATAVGGPPCRWTVVTVPERFKALPAAAALGGDLALVRAASEAACRSQIVYQRHNRYSLAGAILAARSGRPLFLEYNGPESFFDRTWHSNPLGRQLELCERASLRCATRVVVNSRVDHESLQARGVPSSRLIFSPNGVDVERFARGGGQSVRRRLGIAAAQLVIGFVGSFGPWHGAPMLARAFVALNGRQLDCRLLLVGDGPERRQTSQVLVHGGVGARAIFTGSVEPDRVAAHLDACDILVSPHVVLPGGTEFFGSPTKLFEYMAAGKAIVASDIGQIGEVLEHGVTALLTPPGDVAALAEAIGSLCGDRELRARLGSAARERAVARHSWRRNARHLAEAFDEVQRDRSDRPCAG
ncbi:MAG: glycosyltransferase family 4 protein [Solirubrobacterales bacterium]|nr:glycosyltransferase family 4 protein [Solirubrobacterales bacterium]